MTFLPGRRYRAIFDIQGDFGPVTAQTAQYPYLAVLENLRTLVNDANFDRFVIYTDFMIRDLSDLDGDGETTDLRPFTDANHDDIDDYDPDIRYFDQNYDGDWNDFYGSPEVSEEPDTHIKEATLELYKDGKVVYEETRLLSLEKLTGEPGKASGGDLKLLIEEPAQNSTLYALDTAQQTASFNLAVSKAYPSNAPSYRADSSNLLYMSGETDPLADLEFRYGSAASSPGSFPYWSCRQRRSALHLPGRSCDRRSRIFS